MACSEIRCFWSVLVAHVSAGQKEQKDVQDQTSPNRLGFVDFGYIGLKPL